MRKFFHRLSAAPLPPLISTLAALPHAAARVFFFAKAVNLSWDERYRQRPAATEPSEFLVQCASYLPAGGEALDAASGGGRNSVYLAERGFRVTAVDFSREALEQGRERARARKVTINWVQADLKEFPTPSPAFDLAIVFYYRDPGFYPRLREAVRPGGILIYQTFTLEQLRFEAGPKNPAHLLEPGELRKAIAGWELIFYRETSIERGLASLVARRPKEL
jgi:tellurite methyltransferase